MSLLEVVVASLATWQAVDVWRHSEIMAGWRETVKDWEWPHTWWGRRKFFANRVLSCPYCLSVWVGLVCVVCVGVPYLGYLVYGLAASKAANTLNDHFHATNRIPRIVDYADIRPGDDLLNPGS